MYIYLDTANLVWLETADKSLLRGFLDDWRMCQCELVMSPMHIQEIGQIGNSDGIENRLAAIEDLTPCWLVDPPSTTILFEIADLLLSDAYDRRLGMPEFRSIHFKPLDTHAMAYALNQHLWAIGEMRRALTLAAESEAISKEQVSPDMEAFADLSMSERIRVARDLITRMGPEGAQTKQQIEKALSSLEVSGRELNNPRSFKREILGLGEFTHAKGIPTDDLPGVAWFLQLARQACEALVAEWPDGIDTTCETLVQKLNPYDCPSMRLKLAVHRARLPHPGLPTPSDQIDEEHIIYAPYVDLMFVDKRTFTFARQEAKRRHGLLHPEDVATLRFAGSLDSVGAAIRQEQNRKV